MDTEAPGHERRDVDVRPIVLVGAGLVVLAALVQLVLYFQMMGLWSARQAGLPAAPPVAAALPATPPEPRLQTAPADDLHDLRRAEDERLHSYGWIDRRAGIVHLPIERAMELLAGEASRSR